jgi:type IV pilus assembly protein PilM
MSFFSKNSFLAVDVGTTAIKVGEFRRAGSSVALTNYGFLRSTAHLDGSGSALQSSSFRMLEPLVADYLKQIIKRMGTRVSSAVVSLPAFSAFTTLIELPKMSEEDTERAIPFQSRQYIPAPISSVQIDWFPIGEKKDKNGNLLQQIFLMSTPHATIDKYKRVLKLAGLKMIDSEIENVCLARSLGANLEEPTLIIDIGSRSTSLSVVTKGVLQLASQTDFAGTSLTQVLATGLGIKLNRAEALKIQKGLATTGGTQGLSTLMAPMLDAIISEAVRVNQTFEKTFGQSPKKVILSGGSARLLGLKDYFMSQLGVPVENARPFDGIQYSEALTPLIEELSPRFSVMLGLAMKPLS